MKSILLATAFCVVALPAPAGAQSSSRFTGGVELGAARTWDDESFIGTGLVTGLRLGYDLTDRTTIDVGVTRIAHHRQFPQSPVEAEGGAGGSDRASDYVGAARPKAFHPEASVSV